jgi:hypothetical protein
MGGVGYRSGCRNGVTGKAKQRSSQQGYGNQEKARRRIVVRRTINPEDLSELGVMDAVFAEKSHFWTETKSFRARPAPPFHPAQFPADCAHHSWAPEGVFPLEELLFSAQVPDPL